MIKRKRTIPSPNERYQLAKMRLVSLEKYRTSKISYFAITLLFTCSVLGPMTNLYKSQNIYSTYTAWIRYDYGYDRLAQDLFISIALPILCYWMILSMLITLTKDEIQRYRIIELGEPYDDSALITDNPNVLELKLNRVRSWRKAWFVYISIILAAGIITYKFMNHGIYSELLYSVIRFPDKHSLSYLLIGFIGDLSLLAIPVCSAYALILYLLEISLSTRLANLRNTMASETGINNVSEDIYKHSIKMSYLYLNQYYDQTRKQAENGFRITLIVAIGGGVIIALGILAMFTGKAEPAYITTATGVIIEFIASIFFYLYNRTMQNMGDYHNKLVLSQNIAIALEVVKDIEGEEQNNVKSHMVKELIRDINTHINENKPERKSDSVEHPKPQSVETDA